MAYRTHLIGLDKPVSKPLSAFPEADRARIRQARQHEQHRLESVAELLAIVELMALKGVIRATETVTAGGAVYQFGQGERQHGTVGAHCLPGRLNFNGQHLHHRADWQPEMIREHGMKPLPLSSKLRNLYGRVDVVDWSVNDADSYAERMPAKRGLKQTLRRAAERLLRDLSFQRPNSLSSIHRLASTAYEHYRFEAAYVYQQRLHDLGSTTKPAASGTNPVTRRMVLEEYHRAVCDDGFSPAPLTELGFRHLVSDLVVAEHRNF